jgi:Ribosomal protein HS6-type (S12/L30/L7a)
LKNNKVLSLIGLATKAGKTVSGEFSTEKAVKANQAHLVMVAVSASDNTKKKFMNMCNFYKVPLYIYGEKEELGSAMGKEMRASLAVLENGFSRAIEKELDNQIMN